MKSKKIFATVAALLIILVTVNFARAEDQGAAAGKATEIKAQTTCPVMGGKIDKKIFVDAKGYRIYVCCAGCVAAIKANPDKYIEKIKAKGETLEKVPVNENKEPEK